VRASRKKEHVIPKVQAVEGSPSSMKISTMYKITSAGKSIRSNSSPGTLKKNEKTESQESKGPTEILKTV
jgi:hypothetical protein